MALHARALTALEERACLDACEGVEPRAVWLDRLSLHLLVASLWTPAGPAFPGGAEEAGALEEDEGERLVGEALGALAVVSPSYTRSDSDAWAAALLKGAADPSNMRIAFTLAGAVDVALGYGGGRITTARPDRYFGLPFAELTDGHLMAYAAARVFVDSLTPSR